MASVDDVQGHASAGGDPLGEAASRVNEAAEAADQLASASQAVGYETKARQAGAIRDQLRDLHTSLTSASSSLGDIQNAIESLRGLVAGWGTATAASPPPTGAARSTPRPDFSNAVIPDRKLTEYALNRDHPKGKHKARVIESGTGLGASDAAEVKRQIFEKAPHGEAVAGKVDEHGARWHVDLPLTGPSGTMTVRTGWITDREGTRLATLSFPPKGEA